MAAATRRLLINLSAGLSINGKEVGWDSSRRVLAVHGWMDNCGSFDRLLPLLPQDIHFVFIDLPGHGRSSFQSNGAYIFSDYVRAVYGVARDLGWCDAKFSLMGHSMGAGIAALYAGTFPSMIDKLIFIEGGSPLFSPAEHNPKQLADSLVSWYDLSKKEDKTYSSYEAMLQKMLERPISREAAECLLKEGSEQINGVWRFTHDKMLRQSTMRLTEQQVLAFHRNITSRALLIKALDGWPFPEDWYDKWIGAMVNGVEKFEIPGRHHVHLDNPELVAPIIHQFLNS